MTGREGMVMAGQEADSVATLRKQNVNSSGAGLQNLKAYPYCPFSSVTPLPKDFTAFPTAPPAEGHVLKTLMLTRLTGYVLLKPHLGGMLTSCQICLLILQG